MLFFPLSQLGKRIYGDSILEKIHDDITENAGGVNGIKITGI